MTLQAKRAQVAQVAFAAPFDNRHDMIRVPQTLPRAGSDAPFLKNACAYRAAKPLDVNPLGGAIQAAYGTDPSIALEDFVTHVPWIRP
jgi:hypothetical protein